MRCPNCNKFVAYDEPEVEIQSAEIHQDNASVTARVILKCSECGDELKDAEIESDILINHECAKNLEHPMFEWDDEPTDGEATDRYETKDRHGKPIKNPRYQKHFYGFAASGSVKCEHCEEIIALEFDGEETASGFNELV